MENPSEQSSLEPINNHALVELGGYYKNIAVKENKYDTRTNGIVISIDADEEHVQLLGLVGKRIYWSEFKEGTRVEREGKLYAFIKLDDVEGYEDVQTEPKDN